MLTELDNPPNWDAYLPNSDLGKFKHWFDIDGPSLIHWHNKIETPALDWLYNQENDKFWNFTLLY